MIIIPSAIISSTEFSPSVENRQPESGDTPIVLRRPKKQMPWPATLSSAKGTIEKMKRGNGMKLSLRYRGDRPRDASLPRAVPLSSFTLPISLEFVPSSSLFLPAFSSTPGTALLHKSKSSDDMSNVNLLIHLKSLTAVVLAF